MAIRAIRLESGDGMTATFAPEAGMIGVSLRDHGQELLGQRGGLESYVESGRTMGLPLLHPWANRLSADRYAFAGREVELNGEVTGLRRDAGGLPIHGLLAASPYWRVDSAETGDLDSASLRASLEFGDHPDLLAGFPFPHRIEIEIGLAGSTLTVTTTITPTGDLPVPLAFGFHPYLTLPGSSRDGWRIELPEMTALPTDARGLPTGEARPVRALSARLGQRSWDHGFRDLADGAAFSVADRHRRITVTLESGYPAAQVFAPPAEDVICFEPMKSPTDALVGGDHLARVEPGAADVSVFSITVESDGAPPPPAPPASTAGRAAGAPVGRRVDRARDARFRLGRGDAAGEARRVLRGRVDSAVTHLRDEGDERRSEAIHSARKDLKKLRATLRLLRGELGGKDFREENRRYRDAARLLSESRDNDVIVETFESLAGEYPAGGPPLDTVRRRLESRRDLDGDHVDGDEIEDRMLAAARSVEAGGERVDALRLDGSGWKLFEPGLRRTYADGRRGLARVRKTADSTTVHEWRKRVKDLWYQLRLLRRAWPKGLDGPIAEADRLADLLGRHNDLALLADALGTPDLTGDPAAEVLVRMSEQRRRELVERALPIGERLYAEKPERFTARIGRYWEV